jgi:uncharacterized protein
VKQIGVRSCLRQGLTTALKARDQVAVAALRSAMAAIDNAEAVDPSTDARPEASSEHIAGATAGVGSSDVRRRMLSDADVIAIVREQVGERVDAAEEYDRLGRHDQAGTLRHEAAVLAELLDQKGGFPDFR